MSAGSDVCNSIWAPREPNFALWPLDRFCILSSLVRRDAKLQSLNTARPPRHMSAVTSVLSRHAMRTTDTSHKWCPWLMLLFLDSPPPYISSCHAKKNKFVIKHWPQTPPTAFIPFHHNPPKSPPSALHFSLFILSLLHVLSCCKTTVRLCDFYQHTVLVLVYLDISVKLGCCSHRTWRDLSDAVSLESYNAIQLHNTIKPICTL